VSVEFVATLNSVETTLFKNWIALVLVQWYQVDITT